MNSARWGRAQGPTEPLVAGSLATCSLLPCVHAQTSKTWGGPRWMYPTSISTRTVGCSIISAQASPPTSGLVAICTSAWRGGALTTSLSLPDRVKNEDSHEGQEMHVLPQKEMLTLDSPRVEPHIRRASSSGHDAAISKVIMLGKEWEPSPYNAALWSRVACPIHRLVHFCWHARGNGSGRLHHGAVSLPRPILPFVICCVSAGTSVETAVVVCVVEPHCPDP